MCRTIRFLCVVGLCSQAALSLAAPIRFPLPPLPDFADPITVTLDQPAEWRGAVGTQFTIPVRLTSSRGFQGLEAEWTFDPAAVQLDGFIPSPAFVQCAVAAAVVPVGRMRLAVACPQFRVPWQTGVVGHVRGRARLSAASLFAWQSCMVDGHDVPAAVGTVVRAQP